MLARELSQTREYSTVQFGAQTYGKFSFASPSDAARFARENCRTPGYTSSWLNNYERVLGTVQTLKDFDQTSIAKESLRLTQAASAQMPKRASIMANPHAAITGGYWDTPSVLAGLPLAARTRKRTKLVPKRIHIAFYMSGGITTESMAPETAKIARAIWDYTLAGGAVDLTISHISGTTAHHITGIITETRVNCADVASLSLALSPTFFRLVHRPQSAAMALVKMDIGQCVHVCPIPNCLWIGGALHEVFTTCTTVIKMLEISEE